jgi:hypothetical protein
MQPARPHPAEHCIVTEAGGSKLPNRRDAMLPPRERRDSTIGTVAFFGHMPKKAPEGIGSPPARVELSAMCERSRYL